MSAPIYDFSSHPEITTLLSSLVEEQQWLRHPFAQLMSPPFYKFKKGVDVGVAGLEGQAFTGAPIEMQKAFIAEGGTSMLIPVRSRYTGTPLFGDANARGKGEKPKFATRTVQINKTIKPFSIPTGMQEQQFPKKWKKLVNDIKSGAGEWISDWTCTNILSTFLNGYSTELTFPVAGGGLAVTAMSHPNFFVPNGTGGASQVGIDPATNTYTASARPGTVAYETAVTAAVNNLTNATTQACTAKFIGAIVKKAGRMKIPRIAMKNSHPFYPIFLKDSAYDQLSQDPEFIAQAQSLKLTDLADTPLGYGGGFYIKGAAIFNDTTLWCAHTLTEGIDTGIAANVTEYGPRPSTAQRADGWQVDGTLGMIDSGDDAMGILLGASAMTIGTGRNLTFKDQFDNFEEVHELAAIMIQSMVRNETYDILGQLKDNVSGAALTAGNFYENTSSLVFATRSPYNG
jgi:hypothetical protein